MLIPSGWARILNIPLNYINRIGYPIQFFGQTLFLKNFWKIRNCARIKRLRVKINIISARERGKKESVFQLVVLSTVKELRYELGRFTPSNQRFNHINYRIATRGVAAGSPLDERFTPSHGIYRDEPETRIGNFIEDSTTRINPVTMGETASSSLIESYFSLKIDIIHSLIKLGTKFQFESTDNSMTKILIYTNLRDKGRACT